MKDAGSILKNHGLRKTLGRVQVLDFIIQRESALSHSDLSQAFEGQMDRASLYRTLQDFEQHGLVHKVPDDEVSVKYAYCRANCDSHAHHDTHLHFKCEACLQTFCLEEQAFPKIAVPAGFKVNSTEVLIHGTCKQCA